MKTGAKIALYTAGLAVAFGGAFGVAGAVVPPETVAAWTEGSHEMGGHDMATMDASSGIKGVSLSADQLVLSPIQVPMKTGQSGLLSYRIEDASGTPVKAFTATHEKEMHLIVVRSDGTGFRHVHPTLDVSSGTWSIPWTWAEAGSYRVYADFAADSGTATTLSRTVDVEGLVTPEIPEPSRVAETDGYTVTLDGDLTAGASSELQLTVAQAGKPVTALQPYLGAFGHLVALRQGDLAFLHVHPEGAEPKAGAAGGPTITFAAEVPTSGRYLLYLDFQIDGKVHTASFVVDASNATATESGSTPVPSTDSGHGQHAH